MSTPFEDVKFDDSNPEPRCPCVLLLDTSGSMTGEPIRQLNGGLQAFEESLKADNLAKIRVEVAIITFGPTQLVQDFITADQFTAPLLSANNDTPLGTAINLALDKLEERKNVYRQKGIPYYRPWIFLITDGGPTDGSVWQVAAQRVKAAEQSKKVAFFSVGVEGADLNTLNQIANRQPLVLQGLNFKDMFQWLSSSLTSVSHSNPNEDVPLQSPLGWGKV